MKNSLSMSSLVVGVAVRHERFMITLSRRFRRSELKAMTKALCSCSGISRCEDALVSLTGGAAEVLGFWLRLNSPSRPLVRWPRSLSE